MYVPTHSFHFYHHHHHHHKSWFIIIHLLLTLTHFLFYVHPVQTHSLSRAHTHSVHFPVQPMLSIFILQLFSALSNLSHQQSNFQCVFKFNHFYIIFFLCIIYNIDFVSSALCDHHSIPNLCLDIFLIRILNIVNHFTTNNLFLSYYLQKNHFCNFASSIRKGKTSGSPNRNC